ncbi:MAG: hypothetical protein QHH14_14355 [Clostridiales bacterium]|nr:hypothetical protein [Clostridiales bacterium]
MIEAIRSSNSALIFRGDGRPRFPCTKPRIPFKRTRFASRRMWRSLSPKSSPASAWVISLLRLRPIT